jgi:hypothetical protein
MTSASPFPYLRNGEPHDRIVRLNGSTDILLSRPKGTIHLPKRSRKLRLAGFQLIQSGKYRQWSFAMCRNVSEVRKMLDAHAAVARIES